MNDATYSVLLASRIQSQIPLGSAFTVLEGWTVQIFPARARMMADIKDNVCFIALLVREWKFVFTVGEING